MGRFDHDEYVSMTMEFRCNLKCVHCMIEGTMDRLQPESIDQLRDLLDHNAKSGKWKGLILTGSEITLNPKLPELARMARNSGFDHVRIQTHGMHLSRAEYLAELVDAGVDEFFVSVAGSDPDTHDAITEVPGSFERTLLGLENMEKYDNITSITNTVVTERSYRLLPAIVERLSHLRRLAQMEFWFYWPMSEHDEKNLIPRSGDALPYLKQALALARELDRGVEVKNYPQCLLGEDGDALVNGQPRLFIDPAFWPEFMRNGFGQCVYRDRCASQECLGLNTAYIERFGYEEGILHPLPATGASRRLAV